MDCFFVPSIVPVRPLCFRDNIVGLACNLHDLTPVTCLFEYILNLPLQEEGFGPTFDTLKTHLKVCLPSFHCLTAHLQITLKDKIQVAYHPDPIRRYKRYRDHFSLNVKQMLRSLIPGLGQKCIFYATEPLCVLHNIAQCKEELLTKGYPQSQWEGLFLKHSLVKYRLSPDLLPTTMQVFDSTDASWHATWGVATLCGVTHTQVGLHLNVGRGPE